jgi:hypothetical protein
MGLPLLCANGLQVLVESFVRNPYKITIEAPLGGPALVSGHEHDRFALWVKGKSDAPDTSIGIEAQLLHVGVPRTLQRIYLRPSQERPFLAKVQC